MSIHLNYRTMLAAGSLLLLWTLPVHAELLRCSDAAGNVTYMDGPCPEDARRTDMIDLTLTAPAPVALPAARPRSLEAIPVRESAWARQPAPVRHDTTDVTTLKKARENLRINDDTRVATYQTRNASR